MKEFSTITELSKVVRSKINSYNASEPSRKSDAYNELLNDIQEIMSSEKNRSMIYRGKSISSVFRKTLGSWRMNIWLEIVDKLK